MTDQPRAPLKSLRKQIDSLSLWHQTLVLLGLLLAIRLFTLFLTPLNLGGDETQYWVWAQMPDFGYFSKPPLIAWIIGVTTAVCGDGEACVRIASPLFHTATAIVLFQLGRTLFDDHAGFWAAIVYATLPAVSFSSGLISTDVPLLFLWSLALFATYKWLDTGLMRWAALAGICVGFGLLAKYAMLYFLGCLVLYLLITPAHRTELISRGFWAIISLAALLILPNLLWNWANDFPTIAHTASNANLGGDLFHPLKMLEFFGSQFGVFGPILFATLIYGIIRLGPAVAGRQRGAATDDLPFVFLCADPCIRSERGAVVARQCQLGGPCLYCRDFAGGRLVTPVELDTWPDRFDPGPWCHRRVGGDWFKLPILNRRVGLFKCP